MHLLNFWKSVDDGHMNRVYLEVKLIHISGSQYLSENTRAKAVMVPFLTFGSKHIGREHRTKPCRKSGACSLKAETSADDSRRSFVAKSIDFL
jgi:hypothetical protein